MTLQETAAIGPKLTENVHLEFAEHLPDKDQEPFLPTANQPISPVGLPPHLPLLTAQQALRPEKETRGLIIFPKPEL